MPTQQEFETFIHTHFSYLSRVAYRLTGNREDARDVLQEAFMRCWKQWARLEAAENGRAYSRRVLVNVYLNSQRRRPVTTPIAGEPAVNNSRQSEQVVSDIADRDLVWRTLERLSLPQQAVMVLRYYEDFDDRAIAEVMGVRASTVRSHARRALKKLSSDPTLGGRTDMQSSRRGP